MNAAVLGYNLGLRAKQGEFDEHAAGGYALPSATYGAGIGGVIGGLSGAFGKVDDGDTRMRKILRRTVYGAGAGGLTGLAAGNAANALDWRAQARTHAAATTAATADAAAATANMSKLQTQLMERPVIPATDARTAAIIQQANDGDIDGYTDALNLFVSGDPTTKAQLLRELSPDAAFKVMNNIRPYFGDWRRSHEKYAPRPSGQ